MSVPVALRDRKTSYEVYQVISPPVPHPLDTPRLGLVASSRVETEYVAFNMARDRFMLLNRREAGERRINGLVICWSQSPIYVTGDHEL